MKTRTGNLVLGIIMILILMTSITVNAQEAKVIKTPKFEMFKQPPTIFGTYVAFKLNQNIYSIIPTFTIPFKKLRIEFKYVWDKGRMDVFTHTDIGFNITF